MKRVLAVLGLLFLTAVIAYTLSGGNPHEFTDGECPKCHVDASENPKVLRGTVSGLCMPCHRKTAKKSSHPVEMAPQMVRVPADLPLTNGKVTCNTCHNVHETKRFSAFGERTYLLRRGVAGREFCVACHEVGKEGTSHVEVIATAHIGNRYRTTDPSALLDPMSMDCIGCHDGTISKATSYTIGAGVWDHRAGSHPIGVDYRECRMRKGGLHPLRMVSRRLRFFNGKIGCGTCHNLFAKDPMKLAMTNEGSRLCTLCHNK